jgi:hypothetical protein
MSGKVEVGRRVAFKKCTYHCRYTFGAKVIPIDEALESAYSMAKKFNHR